VERHGLAVAAREFHGARRCEQRGVGEPERLLRLSAHLVAEPEAGIELDGPFRVREGRPVVSRPRLLATASRAASRRRRRHSGLPAGRGRREWRASRPGSQRFTALINFTTVPNFLEAGSQTVTQSVDLLDRDTLTSLGTTASYRTDGTPYRTGCSTATGKRFE
jgi:hypothetical protein